MELPPPIIDLFNNKFVKFIMTWVLIIMLLFILFLIVVSIVNILRGKPVSILSVFTFNDKVRVDTVRSIITIASKTDTFYIQSKPIISKAKPIEKSIITSSTINGKNVNTGTNSGHIGDIFNGIKQRQLTPEVLSKFLNIITKDTLQVQVSFWADKESMNYANTLIYYLKNAGYDAKCCQNLGLPNAFDTVIISKKRSYDSQFRKKLDHKENEKKYIYDICVYPASNTNN